MSYKIKWNCNKQTNIDILLLKNGTILSTLAENIISVAGENTWEWDTLGLTPGDDYKIRIKKHDNPNIVDESVSAFTLSNTPVEGLIAFFKMDDNLATTTVIDETGSNNGIATFNTADNSVAGVVENALFFNEANTDKVDFGSGDDLDFGSGDWSISAWCKPSNCTKDYPTIIGNDNPGGFHSGSKAFCLRYDNTGYANKISVHWKAEGDPCLSTPETYPINSWIYSTVVRQGNVLYLYVNADLKAQKNISASSYMDLGSGSAIIGGSFNGVIGAFNGAIDLVRIYNRGLAQSEIITLYQEGLQ